MPAKKMGINEQVADHARKSTDWRWQAEAERAYAMFEAINAGLFENVLPAPVIGFDDSGRLRKGGHYHYEGDGLALKQHIDLRLGLSTLETVVALIHNAVHMRSETYDTKATWYHKKAFRDEMAVFGLYCDKNGDVTGIDLNLFTGVLNTLGQGGLVDALEAYDVSTEDPAVEGDDDVLPDVPEPTLVNGVTGEAEQAVTVHVGIAPDVVEAVNGASDLETAGDVLKAIMVSGGAPTTGKPKAKTAMKKWRCACTNVRCAVELKASCNACGQDFKLQ